MPQTTASQLSNAAEVVVSGGLMEVFKSSAWTLTHRELWAVEDAQPAQVRAVDAASLGAAPAA